MQMFCSIAGIGKSETVLEEMADHDITPHYSSPDNEHAYCEDLWRHRNSKYFLDDCDKLATCQNHVPTSPRWPTDRNGWSSFR